MEEFGYHLVIRPPLEDLPTFGDVESCIRNYPYMIRYCMGAEKGQSKGDEPWNHYDIVLVTSKNQRVDAVNRSVLTTLKIPTNKRRNCKCYSIDEDRMVYQIGYTMKEGIRTISTLDQEDIDKGIELYSKIGPITTEKFKEETWTVDDVYHEYERWLREMLGQITEHDVESYWRTFLGYHKKMIKPTVYQKISVEKMVIYIAAEAIGPPIKKTLLIKPPEENTT